MMSVEMSVSKEAMCMKPEELILAETGPRLPPLIRD